jgi:hypothetical protein
LPRPPQQYSGLRPIENESFDDQEDNREFQDEDESIEVEEQQLPAESD